MSSSLEKLADNLDRDKFNSIIKYYSGKKGELLLRKGVYPYDYIDCLDKLMRKICLQKKCSIHCLMIKVYLMKSMRDYHDLYIKTDVLLLADVFEEFRKVCLDNYKLDPAWYYTSPGLSWDAMLKMTNVNLALLTDPNMYLMVEKGIRGGVSMIST